MSCAVIYARARSKEVGPVMPLLFAFYGLNLSGMSLMWMRSGDLLYTPHGLKSLSLPLTGVLPALNGGGGGGAPGDDSPTLF